MSRTIILKGKTTVNGEITPPGDKSISHRVAMLASISQGISEISGFASSLDCHTTLDCIRRLGIDVEGTPSIIKIEGRGLYGYQPTIRPVVLEAGNSGSTIRMLSGILAAQSFSSVIDGDASLRRRPMRRIIEPLSLMGAQISARDQTFPPLNIRGTHLHPIHYTSRTASAQVKSCLLFAGLYADGMTSVSEPAASRNHTELMLQEFNAAFENQGDGSVCVKGGEELKGQNYAVPGDISSAAFFIAAASLLPDSDLTIRCVGLNPTRTGFLNVMQELGANIEFINVNVRHGEMVGDLRIRSSQLTTAKSGLTLSGAMIANLIDELPILAVVASQCEGRVAVREAKELRVKESDRIRTVVDGIRAMGGSLEEFDDGFAIDGPQRLVGGRVETAGDHRIAMAFAIAGLAADGATQIVDADCASVSFPEFFETIQAITNAGTIDERVER